MGATTNVYFLGYKVGPEPLRSLLHSINRDSKIRNDKGKLSNKFQDPNQADIQMTEDTIDSMFTVPVAGNLEQELNKLLKCNYTGISNLYLCDNIGNK